MTIVDDGGDWIRWGVGIALAGLTTAFGFQQRQITNLGKSTNKQIAADAVVARGHYNDLVQKIDAIGDSIDAHTLDDERTFAKKADMEKLNDKLDALRDMMSEMRGGQNRAFGAVLAQLDGIRQRNALKDSDG